MAVRGNIQMEVTPERAIPNLAETLRELTRRGKRRLPAVGGGSVGERAQAAADEVERALLRALEG